MQQKDEVHVGCEAAVYRGSIVVLCRVKMTEIVHGVVQTSWLWVGNQEGEFLQMPCQTV